MPDLQDALQTGGMPAHGEYALACHAVAEALARHRRPRQLVAWTRPEVVEQLLAQVNEPKEGEGGGGGFSVGPTCSVEVRGLVKVSVAPPQTMPQSDSKSATQ